MIDPSEHPGSPVIPPSEQARRHIRKLYPASRQRLLGLTFVVLVLLAFGAWWISRRHLAATLAYGWLDGSVVWFVDRNTLSQAGATEARLAYRFHNPPLDPRARRLDPLRDLHHLVELDLSNNPGLTDAELSVLADLRDLKVLGLAQHEGFAGVVYHHRVAPVMPVIGRMSQLEDLNLEGTDVTDADLEPLRGLPRLKHLNLRRTDVTDEGFRIIAALPALEDLLIEDTRVSKSAIDQLKKERPELMILDSVPMSP